MLDATLQLRGTLFHQETRSCPRVRSLYGSAAARADAGAGRWARSHDAVRDVGTVTLLSRR
jgi:hypothetical protein